MKNDCSHNPREPDGHRHSHEDSDVFGLAIVVAKVPRLDRKAAHEQNQENLKTNKKNGDDCWKSSRTDCKQNQKTSN